MNVHLFHRDSGVISKTQTPHANWAKSTCFPELEPDGHIYPWNELWKMETTKPSTVWWAADSGQLMVDHSRKRPFETFDLLDSLRPQTGNVLSSAGNVAKKRPCHTDTMYMLSIYMYAIETSNNIIDTQITKELCINSTTIAPFMLCLGLRVLCVFFACSFELILWF